MYHPDKGLSLPPFQFGVNDKVKIHLYIQTNIGQRTYCIKTFFRLEKHLKQNKCQPAFSTSKKELFTLFREFIAVKSDFISFLWDFIAMRTVVVPYEDGRHSNEDGREGDEDRPHGKKAPKYPLSIWGVVRFILKYSILQKLGVITLPVFLLSNNQKECFSERPRHPIPSGVR